MFSPRLTSVFASRWKALWWAAGILMTAYCSIPAPDPSDNAGDDHPAKHKHVNPWAKDADNAGS